MRVTCKYTGLTFTSSSFPNVRFIGQHPLLDAPLETLLSRAGNWSKGQLTPVETYILFVALLKSTDLVTFKVQVKPVRKVITSNLERLLKTAAWIGFIRTKTYLPGYVVDKDTATLSNIHLWLESLEDAKTNYQNNYWTVGEREKLERRNDALERMIRSPNRNDLRFVSLLADWALTASQANVRLDKERLEYWRAIFRARGNELANIPLDDMQDVLDYMELNLDSYKSGIFAKEALFHLRRLVVKKQNGDFFGILDYDTINFDPADVLEHPFKILANDTAPQRTIKTMAAEAPSELPVLANYPSNFEYLKARAKYNIAQRTRAAIYGAVNAIGSNSETIKPAEKSNDEDLPF